AHVDRARARRRRGRRGGEGALQRADGHGAVPRADVRGHHGRAGRDGAGRRVRARPPRPGRGPRARAALGIDGYSITRAAAFRTAAGISMPLALAVLRFRTSSDVFSASMGIEAGEAPRRTLTAFSPARPPTATGSTVTPMSTPLSTWSSDCVAAMIFALPASGMIWPTVSPTVLLPVRTRASAFAV